MTENARLHLPIHVRWGDLDAYNHVNNTSILKLLEEARVRAFWEPLPGETGPSTAVLKPGLDTGLLTLIARQEIEYLLPVPYQRHPLDVQMWFGNMGGSSLEVCYEVWSSPDAATKPVLYAKSTAIIVMVDAASGRPMRLTDEMRNAWSPFVGPAIEYNHRRR